MNPILLYLLCDPRFWWLAVAATPAQAAATDEDARA